MANLLASSGQRVWLWSYDTTRIEKQLQKVDPVLKRTMLMSFQFTQIERERERV